jgi:long-chain acyl-CoA synthetase
MNDLATLPEMLAQSATIYSEKTALQVYRGETCLRFSYADLLSHVRSTASVLIGHFGVVHGERVALLAENRPEWVITYFSILTAGGTVVPVDPLLKRNEIERILLDAGVRLIFVSGPLLPVIEEIATGQISPLTAICLDDPPSISTAFSLSRLMVEVHPAPAAFPAVTLDNLASLIYTSGTTGRPKGVMLSERNLMADLIGARQIITIDPNDVLLSVLPLHHTFECTGGMLCPLSVGATITYARSLKSKEIIEDIRNAGVTVMLGVPLLFEKMLAGIERAIAKQPIHKRFLFQLSKGVVVGIKRLTGREVGRVVFRSLREKGGLASLRLMISGGAALPPTTAEVFNTLGIRLLQGYGLTETSPVATVNPIDRPKHRSAGIPIPGVEIKIADPDSEGVGEIAVRGDVVMVGYYKNPETTATVIRDGWFYTGDLGKLDEEGYLYIMGRSKNLIVTGAGKNVYPEEVEEVLNRSLYILESMVYGRTASGKRGEEVVAIIVPDYERIAEYAALSDRSVDDEMVYALIKAEVALRCDEIADYKRVKSFEIRREELPKTTTRKIKRRAVITKP